MGHTTLGKTWPTHPKFPALAATLNLLLSGPASIIRSCGTHHGFCQHQSPSLSPSVDAIHPSWLVQRLKARLTSSSHQTGEGGEGYPFPDDNTYGCCVVSCCKTDLKTLQLGSFKMSTTTMSFFLQFA